MNKYWLTLYGNTFLWIKECLGLIYNSENKKRFLFSLSEKIECICQKLLITKNLYTVELTNEDVNDKIVYPWIQSIINIQAGYLSLNMEYSQRPISLKPILKVQDNKNYYIEQRKLGYSGKILQNIHELTFYINGHNSGNDEYYKQSIFPIKNEQSLDSSKIKLFIKNSQNIFLSNINIVGNIFVYPNIDIFLEDISKLCTQCTVYILAEDLSNPQITKFKWPDNVKINVLVHKNIDKSLLQNIPYRYSITVLTFSEEEFMEISDLFESCNNDCNVNFIPIYNNKNLSFFESNVFLTDEDISQMRLSKEEIFIRQSININDFGRLTILNNGKVYANVNSSPLGTIDDIPYSIVYKECTEGKSWFKLRDKMPCKNCIYQWLCPPPSNYEIVLNRFNLCHIIK